MTSTTTIIRDVPLSKLVPSEKNVRRTHRETGIEQLAASIAAHGLLQSLSVRPVLGKDGEETGKYTVCGGGRRLAALKLLAKHKQIAKSYAVPCIVSTGGEEEASLAENVVRLNLHPADQFEAFKRLADEQGFGAEEIAARFGLTAHLVHQRLRLGAISPKLMQIYRDGAALRDGLGDTRRVTAPTTSPGASRPSRSSRPMSSFARLGQKSPSDSTLIRSTKCRD
jgi:ParB family chromosome partitioning protein